MMTVNMDMKEIIIMVMLIVVIVVIMITVVGKTWCGL